MAESIQAVLIRKVFGSEETLFAVFEADVLPGRTSARIVGTLNTLNPGERLEAEGAWVEDPRFGRQFRVAAFRRVAPSSREGVVAYLSSQRFRGIGPVLAEKIVDILGTSALEAMRDDPDVLSQVPGIGPAKRQAILAALSEFRPIEEIMVFLRGVGLGDAFATRVYKALGPDAVEQVRVNPYRLVERVEGIGFRRADEIARGLGVEGDSPFRVRAGIEHVLNEELDAGNLYQLQPALVAVAAALLEVDEARVETLIEEMVAEGRLVREEAGDEPRLFLKRAYYVEKEVAARLGLAQQTLSQLGLPRHERALDEIDRLERALKFDLDDLQREAVAGALTNKVFVLTGGPGTGKTTILRFLIRMLDSRGVPVELAAPTGRAAKRLSQSCNRDARTLHRLLEFNPALNAFRRDADHPLDAPFVVVDEASMIDVFLMRDLMAALKPEAHLCLIGDVDQLPPVGPGNVLRDLIESGRLPVARLNRIYRQEAGGLLVQNAHAINRGELPDLPERNAPLTDFYYVERERPSEMVEAIKEVLTVRIPERFGLDPARDVQVLTPMYKGEVGLENLNRVVQALLNPGAVSSRGFRPGDKVMQVRNDYDREVFNGDIGFVESASDKRVAVRFDDRLVVYEGADLDELVLAYAVTVHKSQGSEFPAVVLPLSTQHYIMLRRNLLYTAVTRARRLAVLVGSRRALQLAVSMNPERQRRSVLGERLRALNNA
jgi:exodeoxyribonuclease V alpha subunit